MTHPGNLLHAYLDNELDAPRALSIHEHLEGCGACRAELTAAQAVREAVKRHAADEPSAALIRSLRPTKPRARLYALVATTAAAVLLAFAATLPRNDLPEQLASAHARALMSARLVDVPSSDRHTVKPWFQGKVPYSLPVEDFSPQGFTLEGGRLDSIGGQTVAVLVYRYNAHVIDAFAWPQSPGRAPGVQAGYHLVAVETEGTHFILVSDASAEVLRRLASLISAPR
jgi:anti-sigma factor RsiW